VTFLIAAAAIAAAIFYFWYKTRAERRAFQRLGGLVSRPDRSVTEVDTARQEIRPFPPRHRWVGPAIGLIVAAALWFGLGFPVEVCVAVGALIGVLAYLGEEFLAEQRIGKIELQLADSIDMQVGALRAGASLLAAFDSALQETRVPLRPYLEDVVGRIRLGEDPRIAIAALSQFVPLETFRLFAASLAVHLESGGSLATTLSTVGRTIRDRIELARRVRAQGVESNVSVAVVLVIAHVLGFLMWRTNPEQLEAFVRSGAGSGIVAGAIALQAVGLIWMSKLSRNEF
jgi:tight adherence protein B